MSFDIAVRDNIHQICAKREAAISSFADNLDQYLKAQEGCRTAVNTFGGYVGRDYRNVDNIKTAICKDDAIKEARRMIDSGIWEHLIKTTGLLELMNAKQREDWRKDLETDPPVADLNNVLATFETLWLNRNNTFVEGLANVFSNLDKRFKSHDVFKVKSRVVITNYYSEHGYVCYRKREFFQDIERICALLMETPSDFTGLHASLEEDRKNGSVQQSLTDSEFFKIRTFMNGNLHLWFKSPELVAKINKALRAYYGEVLPDGVEKEEDDLFRSRSTAVSKDLAFYRTSPRTAQTVVEKIMAGWLPDGPLLEPSAGDGVLVHAMQQRFPDRNITAVEIDEGRYSILKNNFRDIDAQRANFLSLHPMPIYAAIVMNPPFYGLHWMDHVLAAYEWLKPGGQLVAILPVTAEIGETAKHKKFQAWVQKIRGREYCDPFQSLPAGSFSESGTNVNTVTPTLRKPK